MQEDMLASGLHYAYRACAKNYETTLQDTCLVYSYADTKCLLLGEEITGAVVTVTNKEVVGVKCQGIQVEINMKTCFFSDQG